MASQWANSFDLLDSGADAPAAAPKASKKRKSKKKASNSGQETSQTIYLQQDAPQRQQVAEEAKHDDFTPVERRAAPKRASSAASLLPSRAQDAAAALEKATVDGARSSLVVDWNEQAAHGELAYVDASGTKLTFAQVLARSKALDKLLGSYLEGGAASEADVGSLGELLTAVAHPSLPHQYGRLLAGAVAALGALLAADPLAPMATVRHGLQGAISLLKGGVARPVAKGSPQQRLATLEGELARQEAALTRTTLPREQSKLWGGVLQTLGEQLDLLQLEGPSGLPAEVMAALRPLQELQAALQARLKAATAPPPPGQTVEALVAEAEAAHARDDAALCRQLAAADARVRELEAQLAAAKAEAGVLRTRRVAAKADLAKAVEQLRTAGPAGAAAGKRAAAALEAGLGATGALAAAVEGAGGPAAAAMDAGMAESVRQRLVAGEVPAKLVGAVQQVVDLNLALVRELDSKAAFYRERLEKACPGGRAARQAEQLAKLGLDNDPGKAAEGRRQRANLEKMVADVAAAAEASAATAAEAAGDFCARLPGLACLPGFTPPAPEYVAGLEAKAAEATALARGVVDPSQAPAKPVPAAAPTGASSSAASGSTPSPSPASEPVVPAPQPGAGRAARAPGAGRRKEEGAAGSGCAAVSAPAPATPPLDMSSLEARLAALEEANRQKDAQIAAMLSSAAAADVAVTAAPLAALGIPPLSPSLLSSPLGLMPPAGGSAGLGSLGPSPRMNGHAAATAAAADGGDGTETGAAAGTGRRNRRRA